MKRWVLWILSAAAVLCLCACGAGAGDGASGEGGAVAPVEGIQMPGTQEAEGSAFGEENSTGEAVYDSSAGENTVDGTGQYAFGGSSDSGESPGAGVFGESDPDGTSAGESGTPEKDAGALGGGSTGSLGIYSSRIQEYINGIESGWGQQEFENAGMSYMCGYETSLDQLGYLLLDLDGDGMEELLIGKGAAIYDMYTLEAGSVTHVFSGGERNAYGLSADNVICNMGSGSAAMSLYAYYRLEGSDLVPLKYVIFDAFYSQTAPWFESEDSQNAEEARGISEEEAYEIIDSYRPEELDFTALDHFWQDLGKTAGSRPGQGEQPYFGTWRVQEYRTSDIYALSQEEIERYLTYTVTYYEDAVAQNGQDLGLEDWEYEYDICTKEDILRDYHVDLTDWWTEEGAVVCGTISYEDNFFGREFFLGDDNSLWIYYEGVFFRAAK